MAFFNTMRRPGLHAALRQRSFSPLLTTNPFVFAPAASPSAHAHTGLFGTAKALGTLSVRRVFKEVGGVTDVGGHEGRRRQLFCNP